MAQASALLSTRVDIAREQRNYQLLDSMNRHAKLQLRLQAAVEPDPVEGAAVPIVAVPVILTIREAHRRILHK